MITLLRTLFVIMLTLMIISALVVCSAGLLKPSIIVDTTPHTTD